MTLDIWVLESDLERLKKLSTNWLSSKDEMQEPVRYDTCRPVQTRNWICVHISLDEYRTLADNGLIAKLED
jgi:hypothetical protein